MKEKNNKSLINRILFIILCFLIVVFIIVYQVAYKPTVTDSKETKSRTAEDVAEEYMLALFSKDYDKVVKYFDYNGLLTYISLYNNWSYNIADEWNEIYELSFESEIFNSMKDGVQEILQEKINNLDYEINNMEIELVQNAKKIDGTDNLYKVIIKVYYVFEGYNYDEDIYLIKQKENYYVVSSSLIENNSYLCENTLITGEYTLRNSLEQAISYIESKYQTREDVAKNLTRSEINSYLYDFRFCKKDSSEKDFTVYSDTTELKDGDKIYLTDLYADNNSNYYEVTLVEIDGILQIGEIIEIKNDNDLEH